MRLILVFLVACASCVSGAIIKHSSLALKLLAPNNLQVNILDEEVIVLWDKPTDVSHDVHYNIQFGRYSGNWTAVSECTKITKTYCRISHLIEDYQTPYKVRVQLEAGDKCSEWTVKRKFLLSSNELQPPAFTLRATSSTIAVHIHQSPILRKIFLFGIKHTIYLREKGRNKTTIAYLNNDDWDHQNERVFTSLHWGKEYCVTIKVEGNGGVTRGMSPQQCLVLPEQEWIIVAVTSLTISGFLISVAFVAACILCYIKRPVKTPHALKSPVSGWRPQSIGEGPMEVVTDKGWFLSKAETKVNETFKNLPTTYFTNQQSDEKDRRPSTDSGVSMRPTNEPSTRQDSGCGSIGVQHSNFPIQDCGNNSVSTAKTDDSGMGLGCHSDASSLNLEEPDSGCLNKSVEHLSQKMLTVCVHESDNEDIFKEKPLEPQPVNVVSGYRTNASLCTCSGGNLCIGCHSQSNYRTKYKGLLQSNNIVESNRSYFSNNQMESMDTTETNLTLAQMEHTFPMLTSLSSFPLMEKGRDLDMNDISISLCDIEHFWLLKVCKAQSQ